MAEPYKDADYERLLLEAQGVVPPQVPNDDSVWANCLAMIAVTALSVLLFPVSFVGDLLAIAVGLNFLLDRETGRSGLGRSLLIAGILNLQAVMVLAILINK